MRYSVYLVCILAAAGDAASQQIVQSEEHIFRVETFATGLGVPWGLAFLPDGRLLVTEREGQLRIIGTDGAVSPPIDGVPTVLAKGQGGLMDVALHPQYAETGWIYLSYSDPLPGPLGGMLSYTAISRGRLQDGALVDVEVVHRVPDQFYTRHSHHYGSRIVFDREGYLYFAIGDRGQRPLAQNVKWPHGKIHRLHDDGGIPSDNPFVGRDGAIASIWSYGHRNPKGWPVPRDRPIVDSRARPQGRRRTQPRESRSKLRLAGHYLRHQLRRHAHYRPNPRRGHGTAANLLGAVDSSLRH